MSFPFDAGPLGQLFCDLGLQCNYRQRLSPIGAVGGSLNRARPTGAFGAGWDATESAVIDSTVDAGTGIAGAFAPAVSISIIFRAPGAFSRALLGAYGLQLDETQDYVYLLASDIIPTRGDLIEHPDGSRYVIGEQQRAIGIADRPVAYACSVEHRSANDVTASY